MLNKKKGLIVFKKRGKQLNDFSGLLRMRGITPTDIDGLIDYGGNAFVYLEGKGINAPFPNGQRFALENLSKSHQKAGNPCSVILFRHNTPINKEVIVHLCYVEKIYFKGKWTTLTASKTVLEIIERWEKYIDK